MCPHATRGRPLDASPREAPPRPRLSGASAHSLSHLLRRRPSDALCGRALPSVPRVSAHPRDAWPVAARAQVLALKRQQLEAKAARARELAEQRAEADVAAGQAAEGGAVASAAEGSATKSTESGAASA